MNIIQSVKERTGIDLQRKHETEVVRLKVALTHILTLDGLSGKEIARALYVSEPMVSYYKARYDGEARYSNFNRLVNELLQIYHYGVG